MKPNDLISIITVVYNGDTTLEKTICSVLSQSSVNLQYIVIDGGSTDQTVSIIKKHAEDIDYWISEPDHGTYDAMNKGIVAAKGAWIGFLNCGDTYYSETTLSSIFLQSLDCEIVYGDAWNQYFDLGFGGLVKPGPLKDLWKHQVINHESMFAKSSLLKENPFNLDYKLAADYDFIYKCYSKGCTFKHVPIPIAIQAYGLNGLSESNRIQSMLERWRIQKKYHMSVFQHGYYCFEYCRAMLKSIIRARVPGSIQRAILKAKYRRYAR